jgi:hypothetical protein
MLLTPAAASLLWVEYLSGVRVFYFPDGLTLGLAIFFTFGSMLYAGFIAAAFAEADDA